jgi:hypothetical protein
MSPQKTLPAQLDEAQPMPSPLDRRFGGDPTAQLSSLAHEILGGIVTVGVHVLVALAVGSLLARLLRAHGLRWTWSLAPLALPIWGAVLPAGWSLALAAATVRAAVRGRRLHREDLVAGGDLAEAAGQRRGPASLACRTLIRAFVDRDRRRRPVRLDGGRLEIGRDDRARAVSIPFGAPAGRHSLVVGATGSGKTVTQTWIACRAVEGGLAAVVVDPKGDSRMRDALAAAARASGRPFLEWTPSGPSVYNPFARGNASEIADKALAGERFTEPHYQRQAQRYLGHAVRMLRGAGAAVSLPALVAQLDPEALEALSETVAGDQAARTRDYLASLTARQRADLGGVRDRLAILAESDVAPWLDPAGGGAFDLLGAIAARAVVYFSLRADSWPLLAQMLGGALVGDLRSAMASLQRAPVETVVVIDEFAALAAEQVAHLFGRARSAGISLVLGTQELSDLRVDGRDRLREQVLGNLSSLIAHRQVVGDSAELVSGLGGTAGRWRTAHSSDGRWTQTRTQVPALAADRVRALPTGTAAVLDLSAGGAAVLARIHAWKHPGGPR